MVVDWFIGKSSDRHLLLLAVLIYGVSMIYSVFLWRKGFRRDDRVNYFLLLGAFVFHSWALFQRGLSFNRCPVNNLFEMMMFFTWTTTITCLLMGLMPKLRFMGAFASPVLFAVGVFSLMPSLDPPHHGKPVFSGGMESIHAATIMLAYGLFGLCAAASAMFLTQQHNLKFDKLRAVLSFMPSIERLDKVSTRLALAAFILLTMGLSAGGQLRHEGNVSYWKETKVLWSALLWLIYAGLLFFRMRGILTGRRFAFGLIAVFIFLVLTFWGTHLLSPLHNP